MNLFGRLRKPNPTKVRDDDAVIGFALHANGRIDAIKQGSGMYGAGFGEGAFSETAFGTQIALSQSTFGWSAAYSVSVWAYRCIEVRASAVSRMPWEIINKRTGRPEPKHPLGIALKRNRQGIFRRLEQSQLLYGETFIELGMNDFGYLSDLFWLNNNGMAVLIGAGEIVGYSYTAMQGGQPQNFNVSELAFMKTFNPFNDLRGMSPTEVVMDEIAISKDVARVVRAYYANDTRVGVIFIPKTNLQPADQERFMQFFKRDNQGVNNAGKPVLMPQDISVERIQEPASLDDVELRESTRREICAQYGVPLSIAGAWDDAHYQSAPEQRKSLYEETIIPECDNIDEWVNVDLMPRFDDSGRFEFRHNYTTILAITEDAQKKNDIYSSRLVSGLITRAEARAALGHPVTPVDDVYYIPTGATVVPANEEALVTPTANTVDETFQQQDTATPTAQPAALPGKPAPKQPAPAKPTPPKQLPPGQPKPTAQQPSAPPHKSIEPPQQTAESELIAWEKKAINNGATKSFWAYRIPIDVQNEIRAGLNALGKGATKADIRAVFAEAKKKVNASPPVQTLDYWRHYDSLMADIGHDWLHAYMKPAHMALRPIEDEDQALYNVQAALDSVHDEFTQSLLGTDDKPGPLVKLIMAGMAAGSEALAHGSAANPQKPRAKDDMSIQIDWNLLATQARDFAKEYVFNLIRNVDDTTRKAVSKAVSEWIESGKGLDELKSSLGEIFNDQKRADLIAQTESTRAYAEGSKERYRRADVKTVTWNTVNDGVVCPICAELEAQGPRPLDAGFTTKDGDVVWPPAHPGCRCWLRPGDDE